MDTITINKDLIPYEFDIMLGGEMFSMRVDYNRAGDFFSVGLKKDNDTICQGEKLVYGVPLFVDVHRSGVFPAEQMIAKDRSNSVTAVTFDNLGETVQLTIDNGA